MSESRQIFGAGTTVTIATVNGLAFTGEIISIGKLEINYAQDRGQPSLHFFPWMMQTQTKTTTMVPEFLTLRLTADAGQFAADQQVSINVDQIIAIS
jgi:hypothetical protein